MNNARWKTFLIINSSVHVWERLAEHHLHRHGLSHTLESKQNFSWSHLLDGTGVLIIQERWANIMICQKSLSKIAIYIMT